MYRITLELECRKCLHRFNYNLQSNDLAPRIVMCPQPKDKGDCKMPGLLTLADTATLKKAYRIINMRFQKAGK
jgi:hypothetical protein